MGPSRTSGSGQSDGWTDDDSTTYDYDNLGRLVRCIHPDAGTTTFTYDPAGNLMKETNPLGGIFYSYTYYRPKEKRYSYMTGSGMTYDYDIGGLDALYHSYHLGSASWKKERFGKPFASERADEARSGILNNTNNTVQHLQYLPYGEPYIDQRAAGTTYSERFRFTGNASRKGKRGALASIRG